MVCRVPDWYIQFHAVAKTRLGTYGYGRRIIIPVPGRRTCFFDCCQLGRQLHIYAHATPGSDPDMADHCHFGRGYLATDVNAGTWRGTSGCTAFLSGATVCRIYDLRPV